MPRWSPYDPRIKKQIQTHVCLCKFHIQILIYINIYIHKKKIHLVICIYLLIGLYKDIINIGPAGGDREFVKNIFMYKVWTHTSKWLSWWCGHRWNCWMHAAEPKTWIMQTLLFNLSSPPGEWIESDWLGLNLIELNWTELDWIELD